MLELVSGGGNYDDVSFAHALFGGIAQAAADPAVNIAVNIAVAPLISKEGSHIGRLIIFDDVTDRAELEQRLDVRAAHRHGGPARLRQWLEQLIRLPGRSKRAGLAAIRDVIRPSSIPASA